MTIFCGVKIITENFKRGGVWCTNLYAPGSVFHQMTNAACTEESVPH